MSRLPYRLITIGEEEVPLAAAPGREYYGLTVAVMLAALVILLTVFYIIFCGRYRRRIRELEPEGQRYQGWNLRRLKETIAEIEAEKTDNIEDLELDMTLLMRTRER